MRVAMHDPGAYLGFSLELLAFQNILCNLAMMSSKHGHQQFGPYHFIELAKMKGYQNENGHFTPFRPHYVVYLDQLYLSLRIKYSGYVLNSI